MATWLIHLLIAQSCSEFISPLSVEDYIIGTLAPDSGTPIGYKVYEPGAEITHWAADGHKRNSDYNGFYNAMIQDKPLSLQDRSFMWGYFVHLFTDNMWAKYLHGLFVDNGLITGEQKDSYMNEFLLYEAAMLSKGCKYADILMNISSFDRQPLGYLEPWRLNNMIKTVTNYLDRLTSGEKAKPKRLSFDSVDYEIKTVVEKIKEYVLRLK